MYFLRDELILVLSLSYVSDPVGQGRDVRQDVGQGVTVTPPFSRGRPHELSVEHSVFDEPIPKITLKHKPVGNTLNT